MCQSAINLITKNLHMVENDELLLRIKGRVALFMLTMEVGLATNICALCMLMHCVEMGILGRGDERPFAHALFEVFGTS
jgi:hypothetical protein